MIEPSFKKFSNESINYNLLIKKEKIQNLIFLFECLQLRSDMIKLIFGQVCNPLIILYSQKLLYLIDYKLNIHEISCFDQNAEIDNSGSNFRIVNKIGQNLNFKHLLQNSDFCNWMKGIEKLYVDECISFQQKVFVTNNQIIKIDKTSVQYFNLNIKNFDTSKIVNIETNKYELNIISCKIQKNCLYLTNQIQQTNQIEIFKININDSSFIDFGKQDYFKPIKQCVSQQLALNIFQDENINMKKRVLDKLQEQKDKIVQSDDEFILQSNVNEDDEEGHVGVYNIHKNEENIILKNDFIEKNITNNISYHQQFI